jgi:hypothetical protein
MECAQKETGRKVKSGEQVHRIKADVVAVGSEGL